MCQITFAFTIIARAIESRRCDKVMNRWRCRLRWNNEAISAFASPIDQVGRVRLYHKD